MPKQSRDAQIFLTKLGAAERQLNAAIRLVLIEEDSLAIHTVASAAYRILRDLKKLRGRNERQDPYLVGLFYVARELAMGDATSIPEDVLIPEVRQIVEPIKQRILSGELTSWKQLNSSQTGNDKLFWNEFSRIANYLKHADKDSGQRLDISKVDRENETLLMRACLAHMTLLNSATPEIKIFFMLFYGDKGDVPWLGDGFSEMFSKLTWKQRLAFCRDRLEALKRPTDTKSKPH